MGGAYQRTYEQLYTQGNKGFCTGTRDLCTGLCTGKILTLYQKVQVNARQESVTSVALSLFDRAYTTTGGLYIYVLVLLTPKGVIRYFFLPAGAFVCAARMVGVRVALPLDVSPVGPKYKPGFFAYHRMSSGRPGCARHEIRVK